MTSKIKVDNIENQCGGAVVTKCGATTTIAGTNVNATTVTATNVVGSTAVKSDNIQAADGGNIINQCGTDITLGASGDTINLASGASQSGFGRTGTVDWDVTPKTASFTADSGDGYFVNTTSGAITVTLPAGTANAIVSLADYAATWQTNNVIVSPNGTDKIGGTNANATLSTEGQSVTFIFVDSTQGWINTMDSTSNARGNAFISATGGTITTCGDFKIHTFTGPGTFAVSGTAQCAANNNVCYMVVAGGGGAGTAGGGAGGIRFLVDTTKGIPMSTSPSQPRNGYGSPTPSGSLITASVQSYPITVGGGGAGGPGPGSKGNNSVFSTVTSASGGGGATCNTSPTFPTYSPGGSGGGAPAQTGSSSTPAGSNGNQPPVTPSQGSPGGASADASVNSVGYGGGGGFMAAGANGSNGSSGGQGNAGAGGIGGGFPTGLIKSCGGTPGPVGTERYFAGGGGGGAQLNPTPGGTPINNGGAGGGGDGTAGLTSGTQPYMIATANTGGGGGGGSNNGGAGGAGGSGIVIIRYKFQ